jgi:hypothetical protein
MGYTHYWHRQGKDFNPQTFQQFVKDCEAFYKRAEIPLANWNGKGSPVFRKTVIAFNGQEQCGHTARDLGITWPAADAKGGVAIHAPVRGAWFAGATLSSRACGGDCSHETFRIAAHHEPETWEEGQEEFFSCCKTAYKPYDLLVTACLISLKHYFATQVRVSSDGRSHDWDDARRLCQHVKGYGADFSLHEEEE